MNVNEASQAHGISSIVQEFRDNRERIKFDFLTMGDKGAILYTNKFLIEDSRCNETLREATKEIIIQVARVVESLLDNYNALENGFAMITCDTDSSGWWAMHIDITTPKNHLTFSLDFHAPHFPRIVKMNGKPNHNWIESLRYDFQSVMV